MQLKPDTPQLAWQGAVSLQKTEDWVMPWRTPHPMHVLFPAPLLERSAMPAGVRISFGAIRHGLRAISWRRTRAGCLISVVTVKSWPHLT